MGELYRCGSNLGGANQQSNANGYCENCGGGSVEYYSEDGQQVTVLQDASATEVQTAAPLAPYAQSAATGSYGGEFSLNTEYESY